MKSTNFHQKMATKMPKVFSTLSKLKSDRSLLEKSSPFCKSRWFPSPETLQSRAHIPIFPHGSHLPSSRRRHCFVLLSILVLALAGLTPAVAVIATAGSSSDPSSVMKKDPLEGSRRTTEPLVDIATDKVPSSKEGGGDSAGVKHSNNFLTSRDIILPAKKDQLPSSTSSSTSKFITKASLDLLTKRLIASRDKNSQQFLNKLKRTKSDNLKTSSNLKPAGDSNPGAAKSMPGGGDVFGSTSDYVYKDYQDPDDGQLEIKTESPPSSDLEPIYKGCPVFANGELAGLRPHGATWSEGDDQCELCECRDGEQRCYYHYCNGPKLGFITPPSAETPTVSEAINTERIPIGTEDGAVGDGFTDNQAQGNVKQGVVKLESNNTQPASTKEDTLLEHLEDTTTRQEDLGEEKTEESDMEEESSGRPPWSFSDDEDVYYDYDDHDNHINNIGLPPKVDTTSPRKANHPGENSAVHENHVVFLDDYDSLDPLDTFEAVVDSSHLNLGKDSSNPAAEVAHAVDPRTGLESSDCDTDCSKSCPYGYKITPSSGCPSCKCLKCPPLHHCRLHCPSGYTTDTLGCPVCICRLGTDPNNDVDLGRVHHTLGGIKDTHRLANRTGNNSIGTNNNSSGVAGLPVHHNDVTYDRSDAAAHENNNNNQQQHHNKNVDPHNHFYDNAFNILKADELSILRDNDDNNDNNRPGLGPAYRPQVDDYTTISSLDGEIYDVDYTVEGRTHESKEEDDLSTTVGWEEVERRHDHVDESATTHDEDCNHTAPPVCQDPSGDRHRVGASWRRDPCTVCRCYARGYAECTVTQCHALVVTRDCGPPSPGECCPRCDGSHLSRAPIPAPSPPLQHSGGVPPMLKDDRTDGGDALKEPVRSDLSSICLVVIGLVGSGSLVACLAIHYWRRYHSAKYEVAGSITTEEAQKLRPVKHNCSDDVTSATPLKPAKCV